MRTSPPPPPPVNTLNGDLDKPGTGIRQEAKGPWKLNRDFTGSINITAPSGINLSGNTMLLDSAGITVVRSKGSEIHGHGRLTSTHEYVEINLKSGVSKVYDEEHGLYISSVISDFSSKVGLRISGVHEGTSRVLLTAETSNTFTGKTIVTGRGNILVLFKTNRAVSIQGDIHISNSGILNFRESNQISKTSKISVDNGTIFYGTITQNTQNTIHKLEIHNSGTIGFGKERTNKITHTVYIDHLTLDSESTLKISGWKHARDFIFIRKGNTDMEDLIKKTSFLGYHQQYVHYREHDKDYWELSALPEPKTYGAIFAPLGTILVLWRRKRKAACASASRGALTPG